MIILEGPDGGGKTTLAKRMCDEYDLEYRRPPEELLSSITGPSTGLVEWWRDELRRPDKERRQGVYDRCFWISEPIYTTVGGRKPLCSSDDLWRGIADLWAEDPLLIFCMTDEDAMVENAYSAGRPRLADLEGKDRQSLLNVNFMYFAFFGMWQQASANVIHWDYNRDHISHIHNAIVQHGRVL